MPAIQDEIIALSWVKVGNFKNPENPEFSSFSTVLHRK
jgi:hypothetical protein